MNAVSLGIVQVDFVIAHQGKIIFFNLNSHTGLDCS